MSFPAYEKYKDSGVEWLGQVPEHWDLKRLGYFFVERREKVSDKDYAPLSVTKNGVVPQLETAAKTDDGDNRKKVSAGDFVINSRSDRKGSSGLASIDGSVSLICTVLKPHAIYGEFAHQLFRSVPFQEEYYRFGKGIVADLWSTNYSEMRNITLAIPSESEQQAIAAFLDRETAKIDDLVAEQERLVTLLAEKRQAVISHAVTKGLNPNAPMKDSGIEWLGEMPEHWEVTRFSRIISKMEQGWSPNASCDPCEPGEWGVLRLSAIKQGTFRPEENKALLEGTVPVESMQVREGDLLVTRANTPELVGDACVVSNLSGRSLMLSDLVYRISLTNQNDARYYCHVLISIVGRSQIISDARGSSMTMAKISQGHISAWVFPVPPLQEQRGIVEFLAHETSRLDALTREAERGIVLLKERRAALISAAVTGKIDVRGLVDKEAA